MDCPHVDAHLKAPVIIGGFTDYFNQSFEWSQRAERFD